MGRIVYTLLLVFSVTIGLQAQQENQMKTEVEKNIWLPTMKEAIKKATAENKPILIYFTGSDWCGPCINLDNTLFHTEKFEKFAAENLVLYTADFPRNRDLVTKENRKINKELSHRYDQSSFPTIILINSKGEVLGRKNGAYLPEYYYTFFEEIVSQNK
ncbi:thioredoxin family protein [Tenacibaculum sp. ZS6-P6]|uniref:thioredoxin family protein n=1 Tax=Tenacibaculum sp. ZS6-P6 TaxID=3447503 RepID=UPI003F9A8B7C